MWLQVAFMCAICTLGQMCIRVIICPTEFAPPTKVEQIRTRMQICTRVHFHKTPFIWPKYTQVQIYTPGVYLHRGVYYAYKRKRQNMKTLSTANTSGAYGVNFDKQ